MSLADSVDLRIILSVLYIITEVMREEMIHYETSPYKNNIESFKEELGTMAVHALNILLNQSCRNSS